jgi:hypothetical protein
MNRFYAFMNSLSVAEFAQLDFNSRKKMEKLAFASLFPIAIYLFVGFAASRAIFEASWPVSIMAGLFFGAFILILERIVMAPGYSIFLVLIRVALVVLMALLGTFVVDTLMFGNEIAQILANQKEVEMRNQRDTLLKTDPVLLTLLIQEAEYKAFRDLAHQNYNLEMLGTDGRSKGFGQRAQTHKMREQEFEDRLATIADDIRTQKGIIEAAAKNYADQQATGLLARYSALKDFIAKNEQGNQLFYTILILLFLLEAIVLLLKLSEKTPFEYAYILRKERARMRSKRLLQQMQ